MANTPPSNIVQLIQALRAMGDGIINFVTGGGVWTGPAAALYHAAADALEAANNLADSSYATYKVNLAARNTESKSNAVPLWRTGVQNAYLIMGKDSPELIGLGLLPQAAATASTIPEPPDGLDVSEVSETSVNVDWDPVANADRYHVYVGVDLATMELKESATASEKIINGLSPGTKYFFYVTSINAAGESQPSNFTTRTTL